MKNITPMARYKSCLDLLKTLIGSVYKSVPLNRAKPKYHPFMYASGKSKGVESDFILIFKPRHAKGIYATFGFSFDYIGKAPEDHTIIASIKPQNMNPSRASYDRTASEDKERHDLNKQMISSLPIPASVFNEQLKALNKLIAQQKEVTEVKILELFSQIFHGHVLNITEQTQNAKAELENKTRESQQNVDAFTTELENTKLELQTARNKAQGSLKRTKEYREREELKRRLVELDSIIAATEAKNMELFGINALTDKKTELEHKLKAELSMIQTLTLEFASEQHALVREPLLKVATQSRNR